VRPDTSAARGASWVYGVTGSGKTTLARLIGEASNGNVESWEQVLSRDSILLWHFRSFAHQRARSAGRAASPSGPPVVRLRSPRETSAWVADLCAGSRPAH
jgi:hypothetical protein